jgi:cobalt-zinc-cadmium resistance protein CzcA
MVRKLIEWALNSPLIVFLLALALGAVGGYSFVHVNVEAYPDPAPAIIEVVAQYPGASAEEVERQVTIPLEVTLAGMPGLKYTRSKSLFGLAHLRNQFDYGVDFYQARQEVINRLQFVQGLPTGVNPQISPESPTGEIFRYTLSPDRHRQQQCQRWRRLPGPRPYRAQRPRARFDWGRPGSHACTSGVGHFRPEDRRRPPP